MDTGRELEGRVALVTGAARNIGRSIALALTDGGAAVVVNTRAASAEAQAVADEIVRAGGNALVHLADVTDERAVAAMVDAALARFGRIDVLVNNAAVRDVAPIDTIDFAKWRAVTGVILDGVFLCARACLTALRASAIINIGGMSGHTGAGRCSAARARPTRWPRSCASSPAPRRASSPGRTGT